MLIISNDLINISKLLNLYFSSSYKTLKFTLPSMSLYLQDAMEVMGVIAVIVNCALIGMSGQVQRMFPNLSTQGTIILIVILEVCYCFADIKFLFSLTFHAISISIKRF